MLSTLAALAPLAIDLHRRYAHGGYAYGGAPEMAMGQGAYDSTPEMPYGGHANEQPQQPDMNQTMPPYAHGGHVYAHGGHPYHYMHGGTYPGYHPPLMHGGMPPVHHQPHMSHGGHMPHYGWGGAFKGALNSAKGAAQAGINAARPQMSQLAQQGANYAGKQAGQMAQGYATKHLGAEAGQQIGQAARTGVSAAGHNMRTQAGFGGNYQPVPGAHPQGPSAPPPAPPASIETHQAPNEMNELPFAGEQRHGGYIPHRGHGGPFYPYG